MNAFKRYFDVYRGLPSSLYMLFFATIINSMGMFVFPFLTLYLTGRLGMSQEKAGFFIMMLYLVYGPASLIGGKLADSFGRKKLMVIAQVLSGLCYIPCGFPTVGSNIRWFLLASVFFDGLTDPARSAMMTDLTSSENRRPAFSLIYLGHNLGFAVGMLLAGFLFENYTSWLFWGNAIAIFAAITLVGLKVPETKPSRGQIEKSFGTGRQDEAHRGNIIQALLSRPNLIIFTLLTGLYGFVYAQHRFILPLQTKEFFGARGSVIYGTLMTLNAVMVILLSTPIMTITQRWKPINAVAFSGFLFALGFGFIGFRPSVMLMYVTTAIWTLGEIVNATNEGTYVANNTPISHRARFQAFLPLLGGIGWTISPPIVGSFTDHFGLRMAWPILGAIAVLAGLSIFYLGLMEKRANKR
jgi:MFS family permease